MISNALREMRKANTYAETEFTVSAAVAKGRLEVVARLREIARREHCPRPGEVYFTAPKILDDAADELEADIRESGGVVSDKIESAEEFAERVLNECVTLGSDGDFRLHSAEKLIRARDAAIRAEMIGELRGMAREWQAVSGGSVALRKERSNAAGVLLAAATQLEVMAKERGRLPTCAACLAKLKGGDAPEPGPSSALPIRVTPAGPDSTSAPADIIADVEMAPPLRFDGRGDFDDPAPLIPDGRVTCTVRQGTLLEPEWDGKAPADANEGENDG